MNDKRKGYCKNFGNCKNADNKFPVEVDIAADFICTECQQDLVEIVNKSLPLKKILITGGFILVIAGVIWGVFEYINFQKNKVKKVVESVKEVVGNNKVVI